MLTVTPYKHQQESIEFCARQPRVFDMSDAGTGKTLVQIGRFDKVGYGKLLVIAPRSLLNSAWRNDFTKFAPHLRVIVATAENRADAFARDADVYVTNTDAVTWLAKQSSGFWDGFSSLVVDESEAFKHHTSNRSKALAKIVSMFTYRAMLGATPAPSTITELWHQVYLLDNGQALGNSFYRFQHTCCIAEPKAVGVKWIDKPNIRGVVAELIKHLTIRHVFEECTDIPPNFSYVVSFDLAPAQRVAYKQMRTTQYALLTSGAVISAMNGAAVATKLRQIASGAVYNEINVPVAIDNTRYELIADLIEAVPQSVVFFLWRHQRDALQAELKKRKLTFGLIDGSVSDTKRDIEVTNYQAGLYRTMLVHPNSGAHGLTLTKGVRTIWASPVYTANTIEQGNRRIYRIGQVQRTETIYVLANDTIEQAIYDLAMNRSKEQQNLLSLLALYFKENFNGYGNNYIGTWGDASDLCVLE